MIWSLPMKKYPRNNRLLVSFLLALMPLAFGNTACVPTDSSAGGSTLAMQVAEQVLTFILDFSRQALAAFLL